MPYIAFFFFFFTAHRRLLAQQEMNCGSSGWPFSHLSRTSRYSRTIGITYASYPQSTTIMSKFSLPRWSAEPFLVQHLEGEPIREHGHTVEASLLQYMNELQGIYCNMTSETTNEAALGLHS